MEDSYTLRINLPVSRSICLSSVQLYVPFELLVTAKAVVDLCAWLTITQINPENSKILDFICDGLIVNGYQNLLYFIE